jgi:hypothetical protein
VNDLAGWMADVTESLCGERPIGVMPTTTLDSARTLRARVAELEKTIRRQGRELGPQLLKEACAERDATLAEVEGLKARASELTHDLDRMAKRTEAAESRLAAIREKAAEIKKQRMGDGEIDAALYGDDFEPKTRLERLIKYLLSMMALAVLEGDAPNHPAIPDSSGYVPQEVKACAWGGGECGNAAPAPCGFCNFHCGHARGICAGFGKRFPCSTTCTHGDAATPGHPQRVRQRSEAMNEVGDMASVDPVAALAKEAGAKNGREVASFRVGYEKGAEAMRAACLEVVEAECNKAGLHARDRLRQMLKAAIEGTTP